MRKFLGTSGGTKNTHFICYRGKGVIFHTLLFFIHLTPIYIYSFSGREWEGGGGVRRINCVL